MDVTMQQSIGPSTSNNVAMQQFIKFTAKDEYHRVSSSDVDVAMQQSNLKYYRGPIRSSSDTMQYSNLDRILCSSWII